MQQLESIHERVKSCNFLVDFCNQFGQVRRTFKTIFGRISNSSSSRHNKPLKRNRSNNTEEKCCDLKLATYDMAVSFPSCRKPKIGSLNGTTLPAFYYNLTGSGSVKGIWKGQRSTVGNSKISKANSNHK